MVFPRIVRPFPDVDGGRWLVSTGEGRQPARARNGREAFYIDPGARALMAVAVQTSPTFRPGTPVKVFATQSYFFPSARSYDVSLDGSKFLMIKDAPVVPGEHRTSASMIVVLNWFEELKARMATT